MTSLVFPTYSSRILTPILMSSKFMAVNPYTFDPVVHEDQMKSITKENSTVVYESEPGNRVVSPLFIFSLGAMPEFKDFKREEDPELEKPFDQRPMTVKGGGKNKALIKKWKRYLQIVQRYKEHKFKPRRNNDPRNKDFYMVTSEKQIKKYHLDELKDCLVEEAEDDEDDDTMKA